MCICTHIHQTNISAFHKQKGERNRATIETVEKMCKTKRENGTSDRDKINIYRKCAINRTSRTRKKFQFYQISRKEMKFSLANGYLFVTNQSKFFSCQNVEEKEIKF